MFPNIHGSALQPPWTARLATSARSPSASMPPPTSAGDDHEPGEQVRAEPVDREQAEPVARLVVRQAVGRPKAIAAVDTTT
jgi:hypothetical protein